MGGRVANGAADARGVGKYRVGSDKRSEGGISILKNRSEDFGTGRGALGRTIKGAVVSAGLWAWACLPISPPTSHAPP